MPLKISWKTSSSNLDYKEGILMLRLKIIIIIKAKNFTHVAKLDLKSSNYTQSQFGSQL